MTDISRLTHYFSNHGPVVLLESQLKSHSWAQKSYLAAQPKAVIKARDDQIKISTEGQSKQWEGNPWQALRDFREKYDDWMFGYFGYDLKNHLEDISSTNADDVQAPDLFFMVPDLLLSVNHQTNQIEVLRGSISEEELKDIDPNSAGNCQIGDLEPQVSKSEYISRIKDAKFHIAKGNCYEVNISHQLQGCFGGSSLSLYSKMKEAGAVPFGSYLQTDDLSICCQSPERFIRKEDDHIFSQPIKGTSPRGVTKEEDQMLREQLVTSQKEQAENVMIVDLVRNDLSKIARPGSVSVANLFEIQSFETVHQMVSTIEAQTDCEDAITILESCFPMGSMTGAPKLRSMQIIEELENYRRGIYSGAIGYINPAGNFDFNVVIRTAIVKGDKLYYSVGGAITSDSDPQKEWDETIVKARALSEIKKTTTP
ncbi:para-aminobenzoate synthetase component 1 [Fodinibius salinus]|uniref:aminodeoxychorismate synthase n=1 Tax=Fodinibius salinus TaxID=860790 RepID=A0A5D3YRX4_9BACT|nr:aminodeoxychorismate synthase component I [Fodinibius salinus]TYP95281.1 para-aminobenzoate synthetase component 1 [Fodinibius salinus]